jgi:hypothetical protein
LSSLHDGKKREKLEPRILILIDMAWPCLQKPHPLLDAPEAHGRRRDIDISRIFDRHVGCGYAVITDTPLIHNDSGDSNEVAA